MFEGEELDATVMVADVRSFTSYSEGGHSGGGGPAAPKLRDHPFAGKGRAR